MGDLVPQFGLEGWSQIQEVAMGEGILGVGNSMSKDLEAGRHKNVLGEL